MNQEPGRPESPRPSTSLSRRRLLQLAGVAGLAAAAGPQLGPIARSHAAELAQARAEIGTRARPFELGQVRLTASRWLDNQNRTLSYLRFVDVDRLLYNFRANHRLSTSGAAAIGGWEAPNFPFRTHSQGHFLTAWAQAWAVLGDTTCRDKANYMVAELAKCQANNGAAGFTAGLPVRLPRVRLHRRRERARCQRQRARTTASTRPWPACSTCGGYIGNTQARDVLLRFAGWVDCAHRPAELQPDADHAGHRVRRHERGAGRPLPADRRRALADRGAALRPRRRVRPARRQPDQLNGLHANTQVPKWIGAAREYKATGTTRYRDIAANAWNITRQRAHLRHRRQQPGRALPRPQRDRRRTWPTTPASSATPTTCSS